jgi:K+-sensing histidine kinase KdpD
VAVTVDFVISESDKTNERALSTPTASARIHALRHDDRLVYVAAFVAPIIVAALLIPWRQHLDAADNALFLVVVIVAVASTGLRLAAFWAALCSALSLDFFLTRPYGSLRISKTADVITEVLLVVVGVIVGELAARGRSHRTAADENRDYVTVLHSMTELTASGHEPLEVVTIAADELCKLLFLRQCSFTSRNEANAPAQIRPDGHVVLGSVRWSPEELGLPTRKVDLPVRGNGWLLGHFLLTPTPGRPVSSERLLVAVAIADQIGAALSSDRRAPVIHS